MLLFISPRIHAQQNFNHSDSLYVNKLMINAQSFYDTGNLDSAMIICSKALAYSQNKNYTTGKAEACNKMADIAYHQSNLSLMAHYDSLALQAAQTVGSKNLEASCLNLLGLYFAENGNKEVAESKFFDALKIAATDETLTADIYNSLGYMYGLQGELDKSVDWQLKSLSIYEKLNDEQGEAKVLDNIATLYYNLSKFNQAITYQKRCISIRTNSSDHYGLAIAYSNISQMYLAIDS
ncbi:MAG: tetratricopeptide repeat protein, partial [Parafilimonas sp.]